MTKMICSGIKHGTKDVELKIMIDLQNDWFEITHTKETSSVMNKSTSEFIVVQRNTLSFEVIA